MPISNVVALKKVVQQHESAPLGDVVTAINIKLRLADEDDYKARSHRTEAGEMLVALRKRVEADDRDWWGFAKDHFDRTRKELEKLMVHVPAHEVAKAAIKAYPEKSDRAIAAEIGVGSNTVRRARQEATAPNGAVEKRVGKDGKARKMPEPKPPDVDMNVIKQAGGFHTELTKYTTEFCERVKAWHAANKIDEESHDCVVQALEMASMRLQQAAQDIDGR